MLVTQSRQILCPLSWNSPGKNTGVGSHSLLQGSNPGLLHCKQFFFFYHLSPQGSPRNKNSWPNSSFVNCILILGIKLQNQIQLIKFKEQLRNPICQNDIPIISLEMKRSEAEKVDRKALNAKIKNVH